MENIKASHRKKWLTGTFVGFFIVLGLFLVFVFTSVSAGKSAGEAARAGTPLMLLIPAAGLAYLFALGSYVRAQGKSATTWIVLTVLGGPLGIFISYFAAQGAGNKIATIVFWLLAAPLGAILLLALLADWLK